jgi:hypothetical protein
MSNVKRSRNGQSPSNSSLLTRIRINSQLEKGEKPTIKDLKRDLCDGVRLLYLLVYPFKDVFDERKL